MEKKKIFLATHNQHKVDEIAAILKNTPYKILSLHDIDFQCEIEENGNTLEENAFIKASTLFNYINTPCCGEDSGLEVTILNGQPGVLSARYAGPNKNPEANIYKLLQELESKTDRSARFRTVICYTNGIDTWYFEGKIEGKISRNTIGTEGFGYDPVFIPNGYQQTFAEMSIAKKNKISHRAIAVEKFAKFLKKEVKYKK